MKNTTIHRHAGTRRSHDSDGVAGGLILGYRKLPLFSYKVGNKYTLNMDEAGICVWRYSEPRETRDFGVWNQEIMNPLLQCFIFISLQLDSLALGSNP